MKKFLTVLLALSVVFTYSFSAVGSVFADTTTDTAKAQLLLEAKENAEKAVNTYYDEAMKVVKTYSIASYTESTSAEDYADAWKTIDAKARTLATINALYSAEISGGFTNYPADKTAESYADEVFGINFETTDTAGSLTTDVAGYIWNITWPELLYNLYTADRDEYVSRLDKIDWTLYSKTAKNPAGQTYLEEAQEKVAVAKDFLADYEVYTLAKVKEDVVAYDTLQAAINNIKGAVMNGTKVEGFSGIAATYFDAEKNYATGLYSVNGVDTIKDNESADRDNAAVIAEIKARIQKNYADYMKTPNADKKYADNYVTLYSYLAEKGQMTLANIAVDGHIANIKAGYETKISDAVKAIEDLEAYAAKYKAEKDANGNFVRDAAEVDKIVANAKTWEYVTAVGATNTVKAADQITAKQAKERIADLSIDKSAVDLAFAKEVAKKSLADTKATVIDDYYPLEAAKVEANYAKALAQIEAATTETKVQAVKLDITNGIDDKDAVDKKVSYAAGTAAKADLDAVVAYVKYANSGKNPIADDYITWTEKDIKDALNTLYGEQGARTNAEIAALNVDAATIAAKLPTVGGLAAAKKAAEDAIAALPAKIALADKETVEAAWEAKEAYVAMGGAEDGIKNLGTLEKAINNLETAMETDFAVKAINVDKKDKDALRTLIDEIDAAKYLFDMFDFSTKPFYAVLTKALTDIRDAELKTVIDAINALPINVTLDDKAQIEAARAAYDAFVKEWTEYNGYDDYNAAAKVSNFRELALAEAALGLNDNTEQNVYGTHVKINSKAAKGYIKISWDQKDNGVVLDGYEVYRSTKKTTGFKKISTFKVQKSKTYKTGMKKGTKYYYYVKGYKMVGDKKVYTHKSITVARTFR